MRVATLPDGSFGFDANATVSREVAQAFLDAGYSFVVRYVRRFTKNSFDLSSYELGALIEVGLGVMVVQHVAAPGWLPTKALGSSYGGIAASEALRVGYPAGATLWCDLEGVSDRSSASEVIEYCNAWHSAVAALGYQPGLYVGDSCGLTATELYRELEFSRYWSAYNLNRDNIPAIRGVQMRQKPYPPRERRVLDCPFEYDEDVIAADALGGTPTLALP
jgi:hypothetical protein